MYNRGTEPNLTPNQQSSMDIKNNVDSLAKEKKIFIGDSNQAVPWKISAFRKS